MKDKIEHKFKELLENQEFPYDSKAWELMKNALDTKMPVSKPTNWNKWFLGGAAITVIAVSSYFVLQNKEQNQPKVVQNTEELISNPDQKNVSEKVQLNTNQSENSTKLSSIDARKDIELPQKKSNETPSVIDSKSNINYAPNTNNQDNNLKDINVDNQNNQSQTGDLDKNDRIQNEQNNSSSSLSNNVALPFSVKDLCIGENQTIENKNSFDVQIIRQSNKKVVATIKSNQSYLFQAHESGIFELKAKNETNELSAYSFEVKKVSKPVVSVESDVLYLKGVPTIKASAENSVNSLWKINGKTIAQNQSEIEFYPYFAGKYTVTISCNENGCIATSEESFQIPNDYNLLAPNAFNPNSFDIKNQSFMPYALTQRDVKFTMIILDPKDGGLLYETDDSSQPWTGVDKRNGQMVPSNQVYIWKVKIKNPLPGEPNEYKGTITKL